jgi:hypothetical protein
MSIGKAVNKESKLNLIHFSNGKYHLDRILTLYQNGMSGENIYRGVRCGNKWFKISQPAKTLVPSYY